VIAMRANAAAAALVATGRWTPAATARLDEAFERAARAALRAPVLSERSLVLRRVAQRVVPPRYRPIVRRLVRRADAFSRAVVAAGTRAVDARRGH
jgi:hypothetical protein